MRGPVIALWALLALLGVGCQVNEQQAKPGPEVGTDKTGSGLPRPGPGVDCDRVGATLAAFEVGKDAPADARAPSAARFRDQCKTSRVTGAEIACLDRARDTWAAKACVPSMFPPASGKADCKLATQRMREAFVAAIGSGGGSSLAQLDLMLPAIQLSCEQDQWPAAITSCMAGTKPGDMPAFQACAAQLSQDLQDKMARRMYAREQQKQK